MMTKILKLDFQNPDARAAEAAAMLITQVGHGHMPEYESTPEEITRFMVENSLVMTAYGMIHQNSRVIGAAVVRHGKPLESETYISMIAIDPAARLRGHGRALLRHVAQEAAVTYGDTDLVFMPLEQMSAMMKKIGFGDECRDSVSGEMHVPIALLLEKTAPPAEE